MAGTIVITTGILMIVFFSIKYKLFGNLIIKSLLFLPIVIGTLFIINKYLQINRYVDEIIISKFIRKSGNTLDGREFAWLKTMKEAGLFGNGESYFNTEVGIGAHNTFIYVMGVYGWIPLIFFVLLLIFALYHCTVFTFKTSHKYKYLPLLMLFTFLALSMGENLMFKISMVASFILIGYAANNKKIVITK